MSYKVKQEDLIGNIAGFPIEVVQAMVDEQVRHGNPADVTVFQKNIELDDSKGGFDWDESIEGHRFWSDIIYNKNFDLFFKRYPKWQCNKRH